MLAMQDVHFGFVAQGRRVLVGRCGASGVCGELVKGHLRAGPIVALALAHVRALVCHAAGADEIVRCEVALGQGDDEREASTRAKVGDLVVRVCV